MLQVYEKMESYGTNSLTTTEIISTLTGVDNTIMAEMVNEFGTVQEACENALYYREKVTKRQIQKLLIVGEVLKRNTHLRENERRKITGPKEIVDMFKNELKYLKEEHFYIVLLNTKYQVIKSLNISKGTINTTIVHPREVFREAVKHSANSMILVHNHPSGDPKPSDNDIRITNRLVDVGNIMEIKVLDHIIIGFDRYASLKEDGHIN